MDVSVVLDELWHEQARWSRLSTDKKRRIDRARNLALLLVTAIGVLGALSASLAASQPTAARALAAAAAVGSACVPILRPRWAGNALRDWTSAREVSEAMKSELYRWLARPASRTEDPDARLLRRRIRGLRGEAPDLTAQLKSTVASESALPPVSDGASYVRARVSGQIDGYYRRRIDLIQRRLRMFDGVNLGLAVLGAVLAGLAAYLGGTLAVWIAVLTTVAAAVSAHVAATQYRFQLLEFSRTAERLTTIVDEAEAVTSSEDYDRIIDEAEKIILGENQAWRAKLAEPGEVADHGGG